MGRVGVVLLNLGGPERIQDVGPFLYNLFADPEIIRLPLPVLPSLDGTGASKVWGLVVAGVGGTGGRAGRRKRLERRIRGQSTVEFLLEEGHLQRGAIDRL